VANKRQESKKKAVGVNMECRVAKYKCAMVWYDKSRRDVVRDRSYIGDDMRMAKPRDGGC
jgi:hypothetical protein